MFVKRKINKIEQAVEHLLDDRFNLIFEKAFPVKSGGTVSCLQIVFAIGPGEDDEIKSTCHGYIQSVLQIFKDHKAYRFADLISVRVRRRTERSPAYHPYMYIEVGCNGDELRKMNIQEWQYSIPTYLNRRDRKDPANRIRNEKLEIA